MTNVEAQKHQKQQQLAIIKCLLQDKHLKKLTYLIITIPNVRYVLLYTRQITGKENVHQRDYKRRARRKVLEAES